MKVTRQSLPPGLGKPGQILVTIVVRMDAGQFCHYRLTILETIQLTPLLRWQQ
jgi:hypothetical protein